MTIQVPWTAEQIEGLNRYQQNRRVHPYTCGNRSAPGHKEYAEAHGERDVGILIATERGWVCPVCDYTQEWAHGMSLRLSEIEQHSPNDI